MGDDTKNVVILIPAYKPPRQLIEFVESLLEKKYTVVVVNDGSGDDFDGIFAELDPQVILVSHPYNRGKGCALKTGLAYIMQNLSDCRGVVTADADGQHRLEDIDKVSKCLLESSGTSLILGSRHFQAKVPFHNRLGNMLTRYVFAAISGKKLVDTQTGLRAFDIVLIPALLDIEGERYEYEMNMLLWAVREKIPIQEVEIETIYIEKNASSHFNPILDSIRIYSCLLKFTLSSFSAFLIDFTLLLLFKSLTSDMGEAASLLFSVVTARLISSLFNFLVNKRLVFRDRGNILGTAFRYYALVVFILGANYSMLYLMNVLLSVPLWIAKILVELVLFVSSYIFQRRFVFKQIEFRGA